LFALSNSGEDKSTISWGQNASNGELGHGADKPRSATNAVKVDALEGANVVDVACGLGFTLLLVESCNVLFLSSSVADEVLNELEKMPGEPVDYSVSEPAVKKRKTMGSIASPEKKIKK
jgi:hypothetical protein